MLFGLQCHIHQRANQTAMRLLSRLGPLDDYFQLYKCMKLPVDFKPLQVGSNSSKRSPNGIKICALSSTLCKLDSKARSTKCHGDTAILEFS